VAPADFESDSSPGELLGDGEVSDAEATAVIDAWHDCTDLAEALAASIAAGEDIDDEGLACIAEALDDDTIDLILIPAFTTESGEPEDEDAAGELVSAVEACASGSDEGGDDGGDDGTTDFGGDPEAALIEGLSRAMSADGTFTEEEAQCVAEGIVSEVGVDEMLEMGFDPTNPDAVSPELQEALGAALLAAAEDCGAELGF
jgi:hypothetical protein